MKKLLLGSMALLSTTMYGASVDAIANTTVAYMGNPAQNATLTVDAAYYNPAGLAHLEDGNYISGGIQIANTSFDVHQDGKKYSANDPWGIIPNLNYVNKTGDWAFYINAGGAAGGPTLDYNDGLPIVDFLLKDGSGEIRGKNAYAMVNLGTAYSINDQWSVAVALKYIHGERDIKIETSDGSTVPILGGAKADGVYDIERRANGFGGTFGIDYRPTDKLNMGLTFNSKVKLEFKTDVKRDNGPLGDIINSVSTPLSSGDKRWRDLPAELKYGLAYRVTDKWTMMGGFNYYFVSGADTDGNPGFDDGWEINIGTEYQVSQRWALTCGYNYAYTGAGDETFNDAEFALDSSIFAVGARFQQTQDLQWQASVMYVNYMDKTVDTNYHKTSRYHKDIVAGGVGVSYKF